MSPNHGRTLRRRWLVTYAALIAGVGLMGAFGVPTAKGIVVFGGQPFAFVLFVLVLLGIGMFHHHTLLVALTGAAAITLYTALWCPGFEWDPATPGLWPHLCHEAEHTLLNLGGLLLGFTLLADLFERSGAADNLARFLPKAQAPAAFALLAMVWVMSSFLDNIAAAMIGGVMATRLFRHNVSVGYLAAIVAAGNAGGAWSVLGDTTTTMMWIEGVSPGMVLHAILASAVALVVFGIPAARAQVRIQPVVHDTAARMPLDTLRLLNVLLVLVGAVVTNITLDKPFVGVWVMLLVGSLWRAPHWRHLGSAVKGASFLLALVWCASLMPVSALPEASWLTTFILGFVSSVFDNIPLTKLAIEQGGYDWGLLSFAVGFGGSMLWFGSSAGVAIAATHPRIRHTGRYLVEGWPIAVAYVAGYLALYAVWGWHPVPAQH